MYMDIFMWHILIWCISLHVGIVEARRQPWVSFLFPGNTGHFTWKQVLTGLKLTKETKLAGFPSDPLSQPFPCQL